MSEKGGKWLWLGTGVVVLCSGLGGWAILTRGHDWGGDFAGYVMQARSIVDGATREFVEQNRFTIEQSSRKIAPVAYPWGTPMMLAPLYAIFGLDMLALKGLNLLCYLLFLMSLVFFLRDRHPPVYMLFLLTLLAFNPHMVLSLDKVLSDIPYLFLATTSVLLMGRTLLDGKVVISRPIDRLCLGVLMSVASFTRGTGLLLPAVLAITHVVKAGKWLSVPKELKPVPVRRADGFVARRLLLQNMLMELLPYGVFLFATVVWNSVLPEGGMSYYMEYYRSLSWDAIFHHQGYYLQVLSDFFVGLPHREILYGATLPFLVAGVLVNARRDHHLLSYAILNWVIHILWPPVQGLRYVFPILPVYLHFVFVGLRWGLGALGEAPAKAARLLAFCVGVLVLIQFAGFLFHQGVENLSNGRSVAGGPYATRSQEMFAFVRQRVEKEAVVVFFKPRVMKMFTDRRSIMVNKPEDLSRGDYLCVYAGEDAYDQLAPETVTRLVGEGSLRSVYFNPEFQLYKIMKTSRYGPPPS